MIAMKTRLLILAEWKAELDKELSSIDAELSLKEKQLLTLNVQTTILHGAMETFPEDQEKHREILQEQMLRVLSESKELEEEVKDIKETVHIRKETLERVIEQIDFIASRLEAVSNSE